MRLNVVVRYRNEAGCVRFAMRYLSFCVFTLLEFARRGVAMRRIIGEHSRCEVLSAERETRD